MNEELTEQIAENPYLKYFIGLKKFVNKCPFDISLLVWFRKRLTPKFMTELNEEICKNTAQQKEKKTTKEDDNEHDNKPHGRTLILDASCMSSDVTYPTDTGLLGKSIEKAEEMIDEIHEPDKGKKCCYWQVVLEKFRQIILLNFSQLYLNNDFLYSSL